MSRYSGLPRLGKILASVALVAVLAACSSGGGSVSSGAKNQSGAGTKCATKTPIRTSFNTSVSYLGAWAALKEGFFADECLDVSSPSVVAASDVPSLVATNAMQFGGGNAGSVATFGNAGLPLQVVAVNGYGGDNSVVVAKDPAIKTLRDLAGKKVGAGTGTGSHLSLAIIQEELGIKNVNRVNVSQDDLGTALFQGEVDAIIVTRPLEQPMLASGSHVVAALGDYYSSAGPWFTNDTMVKQHPEEVSGFLKAWAKGSQWCVKNSTACAQIAVDNFHNNALTVPTVKSLMKIWTFDIRLTKCQGAELKKTGQIWHEAGQVPAVPDYTKVLNSSFTQKLAKSDPDLFTGLPTFHSKLAGC